MKTARKVLLLVLCAALLVSASVMGTLAYLNDISDTAVNTFTVGNVKIAMTESKVTEYGELVADADPVIENVYKLIPGHTYVKDPKITVEAGSENCYLFVEIENGLAAIEGSTTIAAQLTANGWKLLSGNVWYYANGVDNGYSVAANTEVPTFGSFTISGTADVSAYETATIIVTAYAVQSNGFDTAADAWAETKSGFGF